MSGVNKFMAGRFGKKMLAVALGAVLLPGCSYIKLKGSDEAPMDEDVALRPASLPEPEAVTLPTLPSLPEPAPAMEEPVAPAPENYAMPPAEPEVMVAEAPAAPAAVYSLQLLGTTNMLAAQKFIDDYQLGDRASIGATSRQGSAWFVVLYGAYQTSAEAKADIAKLPAAVRATKPWPRKLDTL